MKHRLLLLTSVFVCICLSSTKNITIYTDEVFKASNKDLIGIPIWDKHHRSIFQGRPHNEDNKSHLQVLSPFMSAVLDSFNNSMKVSHYDHRQSLNTFPDRNFNKRWCPGSPMNDADCNMTMKVFQTWTETVNNTLGLSLMAPRFDLINREIDVYYKAENKKTLPFEWAEQTGNSILLGYEHSVGDTAPYYTEYGCSTYVADSVIFNGRQYYFYKQEQNSYVRDFKESMHFYFGDPSSSDSCQRVWARLRSDSIPFPLQPLYTIFGDSVFDETDTAVIGYAHPKPFDCIKYIQIANDGISHVFGIEDTLVLDTIGWDSPSIYDVDTVCDSIYNKYTPITERRLPLVTGVPLTHCWGFFLPVSPTPSGVPDTMEMPSSDDYNSWAWHRQVNTYKRLYRAVKVTFLVTYPQ
jgi:hypothetical protein